MEDLSGLGYWEMSIIRFPDWLAAGIGQRSPLVLGIVCWVMEDVDVMEMVGMILVDYV